MISSFTILALLLVGILSAANAPIPFCNSRQIYQDGPLSPGQKVLFDMSDAFSGYNLDISIVSNTSTARIVQKFAELDRQRKTIPDLISHHIDYNGNQWGKQSFLLYKDQTGSISLGHGVFKSDNSSVIPDFDNSTLVSTEKFVDCFGAALFYDYGLAIVDCVRTNSDGTLQNLFYYLDLANYKVTKKVQNTMFIPFEKITKRTIQRFRDPETGYTYLLRVYEANGVGSKYRDNTYMQIFSAKDPQDLQLLRIIDRTMLNLKTLAIVDMKVYMGDIFFLDYLHGLFRLDILKNQQVAILGRYRQDGFSKFAVYSDDLQNQVIIALANAHAVYQINWKNYLQPSLINKYSLMEHSHIRQVYMNDRFLIVQSSANATNQTSQNFEMDYTWIFNKGARTYMNAYHVVNHNSSKVQLDLNNKNDRVIFADQNGLSLYQLSNQWTTLQMQDSSKVGQTQEIVFMAKSTDPLSKKQFPCQQKLTIFFTHASNSTIWPTGYKTPTSLSSNYPGEVQIGLRSYATGANLSYQLVDTSSETYDMPQYWINKINQTKVIYNGDISDIIFFHTQVIPEVGDQIIIYYAQDALYKTHVSECKHIWESATVTCNEVAKYTHESQIVAFTTSYYLDPEFGNKYYYLMVFQRKLKQIRAYDFIRHRAIFNITYEGLQQAQVTSLASSNGFVFVLRAAVKTIDVYKMSKCTDEEVQKCTPDFSITAQMLAAQGIHYFAPKKIITNVWHPQVLFIKCLGSVIIIDVDNKERVTVLDEIRSNGAQDIFSQVAVNRRRMMIVSRPDLIEIFSLDFLYVKNQVFLLKTLPLYNYQIPSGADIQFSDADPVVYVNARDINTNKSVVLIYNTLQPSASGLYGVINLPAYYTRPALQIQVSGFIIDFLNIKTPTGFQVFRIFNEPFLSIKDVFLGFNFTMQIKNPSYMLRTDEVSVQTVNYPDGFTPTDQLNKTLENYKIKRQGNYTWEDRLWFKGHVVGYNFTCQECDNKENNTKGKVRVREHVQTMRKLPINANDYIQTFDGGISVNQDLFKFYVNGSIRQIILLPDQKSVEFCQRVASPRDGQTVFTACVDQNRGTNLYVSTRTSFKAWSWGPFKTSADSVRNLEIAGDILALTDTTPYPQYRTDKGQIYLYSLGFDIASSEELDELQVIDENDLLLAHGFDQDQIYIANSYLTYNSFSKIYKLYLTEIDSGLFVVDFKYELGRRQINILQVQFVDVKQILIDNDLHMPTDASFFAVTLAASKYNPHFDTQSMLITTNKYHNFEILLAYDDDGHIVSSLLHRVHYRYGYYQVTNNIRSSFGYFAVSYVLPPVFQIITDHTKQIIAVYDTFDYPHESEKGYSERYMLGGFQFNKTSQVIFGFNHTFDPRSNGSRTGLVITSHFSNNREMYELSLSRNLTAHLDRTFKNQELTFIPYSDFQVFSFKIALQNFEQEEEQILAIIITILVILTTIGFIVYIVVVIQKKKKQDYLNNEQRASLLTDNETIRNTIVGQQGYQPPKSSDSLQNPDVQDEQNNQQEQDNQNEQDEQDEQKIQNKVEKQEQQKQFVQKLNEQGEQQANDSDNSSQLKPVSDMKDAEQIKNENADNQQEQQQEQDKKVQDKEVSDQQYDIEPEVEQQKQEQNEEPAQKPE